MLIKQFIFDRKYKITFHSIKTVREKDSLALSSRNSLLSKESRLIVPTLYDTLKNAIIELKKFQISRR